ncbi:uncharacterized protein LOC100591818 [Nomascus leucogenys]|uniref:uncharacterized protein LOC100591818 n=1 Tax=Nomascus leucogenys TaxID=61853 RepID=UPI00020AE0A2|nr:uncharacterized protein LOC100591818 [Nomascus leucogenys]
MEPLPRQVQLGSLAAEIYTDPAGSSGEKLDVWSVFHWTKIKVLAGLPSLLETLRENLFPCLFQILEATCIPWLLSPIFHLWSQQQYIDHEERAHPSPGEVVRKAICGNKPMNLTRNVLKIIYMEMNTHCPLHFLDDKLERKNPKNEVVLFVLISDLGN